MEEIKLILAIPPRSLNPNSREHWRKIRNDTKIYRLAAWAVAYSVLGKREDPLFEVARSREVFFFKKKARRDERNMVQRLKPAFDGFQDAKLITDDDIEHLKHDEPEFHIDPDKPRVEITIRRAG